MPRPEDSTSCPVPRREIDYSEDCDLAKAVEKCRKNDRSRRSKQRADVEGHRGEVRRTLLESPESDPYGFERIIGRSDLSRSTDS